MKRQPIIWGIILVLLLSSITPIASMKLNDGWIYDEETGILSIEFSGEIEESHILKYGLIECGEVGVIYSHEYLFPTDSKGYIEISYDKGKSWILKKEYNESSVSLRDLFVSLNIDSLWIRFSVESARGDGYWRLSNIDLIGETRGNPPKTIVTIAGTFEATWHIKLDVWIDAYDEINDIKEIHYLLLGKENIIPDDRVYFKFYEEGVHSLIVWSVDIFGNEEVPHMVSQILRLDPTPPHVKLISPEPGIYIYGNRLSITTNKTIIIGGFEITAEAYDNTSGMYTLLFLVDGNVINYDTEEPYSRYCGVKHNGKGVLKIIAEDLAGNTAEERIDIYYYNFF